MQRIAGDGIGDTRWKVPGVLDWSTGVYNTMVDVTKDTTTLYASDRDVFLFLVDDMNPIEAGTLPDGSPDLFFRGFYCWNSEVGAKTLGIASFYLRAVCQNRNLWVRRGGAINCVKDVFSGRQEQPDAHPTYLGQEWLQPGNRAGDNSMSGQGVIRAETTVGQRDVRARRAW